MAAIKDISTLQGAAQLNAAIRKEKHFSALFAARDAQRLAATGHSPFRLNPASLKPVAAAIGAVDKQRRAPDYAAKKEADLEALQATLAHSLRAPQEKTRLPRTAASEYGWHWADREAEAITRRPLAPTWQKRCGEVEYAEVRGAARAPPSAPTPACVALTFSHPRAQHYCYPHPGAQAFASVFLAGPFNKTQPICRTTERAAVAKK